MAVWPIFLDRFMYQEPPVPRISVGDTISWDVRLVDGQAAGWPADVLVDTTIQGVSGPTGTSIGIVEAGGFSLCWDRGDPIPSGRTVRAGLSADWFLPPPDSSVTWDHERGEPKRDEHGRLDVVSTSMKFEGPEPGEQPAPQVTGLLVRVNVRPHAAAIPVRG